MKTIDSYITEKLKINKNTVSKSTVYNYHPKDREKLKILLRKLLEERGKDADLNDIDVSGITDMAYLFNGLDPHNIDISEWNVSNAKDMDRMFYNCKNFNSDLSDWDVSNVEDMYAMFAGCKKFDSDLSNWNVYKVDVMVAMFRECPSLKNIPSWYHD